MQADSVVGQRQSGDRTAAGADCRPALAVALLENAAYCNGGRQPASRKSTAIDNIEGRSGPGAPSWTQTGRRKSPIGWNCDPAEKRKPWCVEIPRLAELAWQRAVAQRDTFWRSWQLAHRIRDYLPEQGQLFVGNSSVVRLIDALPTVAGWLSGESSNRGRAEY